MTSKPSGGHPAPVWAALDTPATQGAGLHGGTAFRFLLGWRLGVPRAQGGGSRMPVTWRQMSLGSGEVRRDPRWLLLPAPVAQRWSRCRPRLSGSAHVSPRRADPSRGVCVCGIMCVRMRLSACMPVACVRVRMHVGVHLCVSVASEAEPCVRAPGCERAAHQPRCEGAPKAGRAPPPRNEGPSGPAVYCHQQNFSHT